MSIMCHGEILRVVRVAPPVRINVFFPPARVILWQMWSAAGRGLLAINVSKGKKQKNVFLRSIVLFSSWPRSGANFHRTIQFTEIVGTSNVCRDTTV